MARVSKNMIVVWLNTCFIVYMDSELRLPKIEGTADAPIEVDESYFSDNKTYNRS